MQVSQLWEMLTTNLNPGEENFSLCSPAPVQSNAISQSVGVSRNLSKDE